jgi:hypothetical protein
MKDHPREIFLRGTNSVMWYEMVAHRAGRVGFAALLAAAAGCVIGAPLQAQKPALAQVTVSSPLVEYSVNESGGRVSIADPRGDSAAVDNIRLTLLETVAGIRRGDFRGVKIFRSDGPEVRLLAARHDAVRCVYRPLPRGGELVLLSDDAQVVAAIHQLLAAEPPRELEE